MDDWHSSQPRGETLRASEGGLRGLFRTRLIRACSHVASAWEGGRVERDDAADHTVGPRFFNLEPDGFAVLGGLNLAVEYVDPAVHMLLPEFEGDIALSSNENCRRVCEVAVQVLETGVSALVRGLPSVTGGTVDLMLKRIDADNGRRVLALARIIAPEPSEEVQGEAPSVPEGPSRFERVGPLPVAEPPVPPREPAMPPVVGPPVPPQVAHAGPPLAPEPVSIPDEAPRAPLSREAVLAAEPVARAPVAVVTEGSFAAALEHIGVELQEAKDSERGLEQAVRDAAVALGCSTASLMLRRNRTSVVEVAYGMPAEYRGLRFRDDQAPHGRMSRAAGDVIVIEDANTDDRIHGARLRMGDISAILAVPLLANDERIGVVYFNWSTPQHFSAEQRAFVRALSSILAPHAQVLRLLRVADREATYVATLLDTVRAVSNGGLRSSIAAAVLEVLHDRLGLDYGDIRLGEDHYRLRTLATLHGHDTLPTNGAPSELGQQAVYENRIITGRTEEAPEDRDLDGIRHISVPFDVVPDLVGVMDLSFLGSRRFTPDEMELFGAVGRLLSLAFYSCHEDTGREPFATSESEPELD
jgi:GAF domain